jgi:hypothetical protein
MKCKECEGEDFQGAHRNVAERIAYYAVPFHVLECLGCGAYRWGLALKPAEKYQWVGHIATPLVLLLGFWGMFALFGGESSDIPASEQAEISEQAMPDGEAQAAGMADTEQSQSDSAPSQAAAAGDSPGAEAADPYQDSREISERVYQQALKNGGSPPPPNVSTGAETMKEEPTPEPVTTAKVEAASKPVTTAKLEGEPPPAPPPRRKPALEQIPQETASQQGIVQGISHQINADGSLSLTLSANADFPAPKAAVSLSDKQYVDIPGDWRAANGVANHLDISGFPVVRIRFGFGNERLRVVFDQTQQLPKPEVINNGQQLTFILRGSGS